MLRIDPTDDGVVLKMAFIQAKRGDKEAAESFQIYCELNKDDKEALENVEKIKEEAKLETEIHICTKIIED